jgi:hypothetical protein
MYGVKVKVISLKDNFKCVCSICETFLHYCSVFVYVDFV